MWNIRHILCPMDFSPPSHRAFRYAVELARAYGATLHLLHVRPRLSSGVAFNDEDSPRPFLVDEPSLRRRLRDLAMVARASDVQVKPLLLRGSVRSVTEATARSCRADVVILGTHGYRGWERWTLGSTAEHLLRRLPVPLLLIPGTLRRLTPLSRLRRVLVTTDFSQGSLEAIGYAVELGREFNGRLTLLHVVPTLSRLVARLSYRFSPAERSRHLRVAASVLRQLIPDEPDADITPKVASGVPYRAILDLASKERSDLIVMNIHGAGFMERALLGTTAERVIRASPCPVLAIPPGRRPA